jgi:hypothetical protein
MTTSVFTGTIKEKLIWLINMIGTLHHPMLEYIKRWELSYKDECPQIKSIEIKIIHVSGHHEILIFDETELQNIEIVTKMKKQLLIMERTKWKNVRILREQIRKIKNMREEIKMMENME